MSHTPKHLRGLENVNLSPEEERELMDLRTGLDRVRRRVQSEQGQESWGFPVPRPMALLFDALPSPFTVEQADAEAETQGLNTAGVTETLDQMRRHELVSDTADGSFVKHPEAKNWF